PDSGFSSFADIGGAQVLATGKSAGAEIDIKYAVIGAALGGAIAAVFLALKVCMIKKHLFDIDSSNLRSTTPGFRGKGAVTRSLAAACPDQEIPLRPSET
uniref:Uncharacterized protein n=1 Tax=Canis lupus dingo TaxID=286419 RepID=A0A8C0LMJ2_CANLU